MTYKVTAFPPQDTLLVVSVDNIKLAANGTYESDVFTTDGFGKIIGYVYASSGGELDFKVWQGPNEATGVSGMRTYSARESGNKYNPSSDPNTKNGWVVDVVAPRALVQLIDLSGSARTVDELRVYLRRV